MAGPTGLIDPIGAIDLPHSIDSVDRVDSIVLIFLIDVVDLIDMMASADLID